MTTPFRVGLGLSSSVSWNTTTMVTSILMTRMPPIPMRMAIRTVMITLRIASVGENDKGESNDDHD